MRATRALSTATFVAGFALLLSIPGVGCGGGTGVEPKIAETAPPVATKPAPPAPGLIPATADKPVTPDKPAPVVTHKYAVATENATASDIAMEVLERGGTAVDAAIAATLAVGVVHPVSSGIGGGGFVVVYDAKTKDVKIIDFRETAPKGLKPNELSKRPPEEKKRGVMTGTPGEIAGLFEMHSRWGKLAFVDLVRGAADAAEKGFPVSAHMARALKWNDKWLLGSPRYGLFAKAGAIVPAGEIVKNPALAATLRRIGAEGKKAFYEGAIAADIIATSREGGGHLTAAELQKYEVKERTPLRTRWEGYEIATMPPPSAGGLMMIETLQMHSKADLSALGHNTGAYAHLMAETFRGAIADRMHFIGDPEFVKADIDALTAPERMKARKAQLSMTTTTQAEKFPLKEAGTTHIVVVDAEGNVACVTSTVNNMFGAKLVTQGGFLLNDELDDFTNERLVKLYGKQPAPNAPRPLARPVSSMTPTIVLRDGKPVLALGGSGGTRIATGTTQVLLGHLVFGLPVGQAVAAPRIETPPSGGLSVDPAIGADVLADLGKRGEVVDTSKPNFSGVQAISIQEGPGGLRVLEAGADPRKGGAGLVK